LSNKDYTLTINSDPNILPDVEEFILKIGEEIGLEQDVKNALALSVIEGVMNCIHHGNKDDIEKKIDIKINTNSEKIVVKLKDSGEGFNPTKIPDPTKPENILKDSGRGMHIIKSYMNKLEYNFTPDGTETIITLNINSKNKKEN